MVLVLIEPEAASTAAAAASAAAAAVEATEAIWGLPFVVLPVHCIPRQDPVHFYRNAVLRPKRLLPQWTQRPLIGSHGSTRSPLNLVSGAAGSGALLMLAICLHGH